MNKKIKIIAASMLIVSLIMCGLGLNRIKSSAEDNIIKCDISLKRDTYISIKNGKYTIERKMLDNQISMGEDGVWTIFVYMCGSDYETKNGAASKDIEEMVEGSNYDNVRVILQTGGSKKWNNSLVDPTKLQRFEIYKGKMTLVQEQAATDNCGNVKSMGNPDQLYEFLSWGIDNYASEKMGLVFWNHGGGSSDGVCYDELASMDSLKLGEIELALCNTRKKMTSTFEFIAFDACVMQTIETANILVPYAKYMVGSETAELNKGLEYTEFLQMIGENKDVATLDVCKKICDSSYNAYLKSISGLISSGSVVFSVVDLSQVDRFLYEFNKVAQNLYNTTKSDTYYKVLNKIKKSTRFGAGQVDIYDMLSNINDDVAYVNIVRSAFKDLVVYNKKSTLASWYNNPNGLSIFICSDYAQLQNYNNLSNIAVSPYIMNYYESILYGDSYGNLIKYNEEKIAWENSKDYYSSDFSFVNTIFEDEKEYRNKHTNFEASKADYLDKWFTALNKNTGINILDEASSINCEKEIALSENNHYGMQLDSTSVDKISSVKLKMFSKVYNELEGKEVYRELGVINEVSFDRNTGIIEEMIDGKWLVMPNGYPLPIREICKKDNYVRYISPCYINDKYVYLYSTLDLNDNSVQIEGYADVYANNCIQTKMLEQLREGDCLQPMFMYTDELEKGSIELKSEMNYGFCDVDKDFTLKYSQLQGDDLYFSFILEDVFGNEIYTPILNYTRGE